MTISTIEHELEPLWAVYDKDGTVLTTLNYAKEGSYWAYKQKLEDTYVGPYPDAGRPMLPLTTECPDCTAGKREGIHLVPVIHGIAATGEARGELDPSREPEEVTRCYKCKGFGHIKMDGYSGFANEQTFLRAEKTGKMKGCGVCLMSGWTQYVPVLEECYSCKGLGMRPTWDSSRPILPPEVSDCDTATPEFMRGWLESVTITVNRSERGLSWGEAHLGLAGFGSCVDYGDAWKGDDDTLIDEVVERISTGEQYIKFIDKRTRIFAPALIIDVTRNGYSILAANVPARLGGLPPTYFPAIFEEI